MEATQGMARRVARRGVRRAGVASGAALVLLAAVAAEGTGQELRLRRIFVQEGPAQAQEGEAEAPAEKPKEEAKKPAEGAEKPPARKKEPSPPMFRMRDGGRVAGTPDVQEVRLATAYGELLVPLKDVVSLRFAGTQDPKLQGRIEELVRQLGSDEFDLREEAMQALREIGQPALESLQKAVESTDEEVKSRAEKLVGDLEDEAEDESDESDVLAPIRGPDDEVVTVKFVARGRVAQEIFTVDTPYGTLKLHRDDILSVVFQEGPLTLHSFEIGGEFLAAAGKWKDTGLKLVKGGRFEVKASGSIQIQNYNISTGPEGTSNINGNQLEKYAAGALVGRIGEKGKAFLLGSDHKGEAEATGNLFLGISLRDGQTNGNYDVKVRVEEEG